MGKSLVINGIDATPTNLGRVEFVAGNVDITETLQTITSTQSGRGAQFIHYAANGLINAFQLSNNIQGKIGYIDVSQYAGRTLVAYIQGGGKSSNYEGGAWWRCFTSDMLKDTTISASKQNAVTVVEYVDGTGETRMHTFFLPIPTGAKCFIFDYKETYESEYKFIII